MQHLLQPIIWIIDDDMVTQFNIKIKIRQTGLHCAISCFENAHDALGELIDLELQVNGLPDIILLDLNMPYMTGWEFLEQLKNLLTKQSYPRIYILSSFQASDDIERAKNHAMVKAYFMKPITADNIKSIIRGYETLQRKLV